MGRGGIIASGGNRKTLARGNHLIENCKIHELSRIDHTYTPGILLTGVGNRAAHNLLYDIPSSALRVAGNDHVVELNEIHHVVQESDDQGAVDMWGNPTYRGNVFRHNYWHHIGNQVNPHEEPFCGQAGIRLDDAICGTGIYGNIFHRSSAGRPGFGAVQIHGGKDNVIDGNVFVECMAAVSFTPWGEERWRQFTSGALDSEDIDASLYMERYPALKRLSEDHDVNLVCRNLILNCGEFLRRDSGRSIILDNVVVNADAALAAGEALDWTGLTKLMQQSGFARIPFEEIGLYESPVRKDSAP